MKVSRLLDFFCYRLVSLALLIADMVYILMPLSNCNPGSLEGSKIKGKIVVCKNSDGSYSKKAKVEGVKSLGGLGILLVDNRERAVAFPYGDFPLTVVSSQEADGIFLYMNSTG